MNPWDPRGDKQRHAPGTGTDGREAPAGRRVGIRRFLMAKGSLPPSWVGGVPAQQVRVNPTAASWEPTSGFFALGPTY